MLFLDTNVLIYAFREESPFYEWSLATLAHALGDGGACINPVVLAEICVGDSSPGTVEERTAAWGVEVLDLPAIAAPIAARAYAKFIEQRATHRLATKAKMPLPDFFIGAHASLLGVPLATADTGRYQTYFPELELLTP